MTEVNQVT